MNKIGIIVNPFSGKDIRRATTRAANVGNVEKRQKVIRIIEAMKQFNIEKVYLMHDSYDLNASIAGTINNEKDSSIRVELVSPYLTDEPEDTIRAVEIMKGKSINCIIALGGDGTCRLIAKTDINVPLIPLSTGTNNVYPEFWEGSTVGVAASYIAKHGANSNMGLQSKRIEVYINNKFVDISLVDAAVTKVDYIGTKAIFGTDELDEVIVSRCAPELIGLSALIGGIKVSEEADDFGYRMKLCDHGGCSAFSSMNSGELIKVTYSELEKMDLGAEYTCCPDHDGTIALDGERTLMFNKGDEIKFVITRKGPFKADVKKTLREAVKNNFFHVSD